MASKETKSLTVEAFVARVMVRLPVIIDEQDRGMVKSGIAGQHSKGWSIDDAVAWNLCLQEVDPSVAEDLALARMARISAKYAPAV